MRQFVANGYTVEHDPHSISDDDVIVEFGNNKNCRISMQKKAIAQVEKPSDSTSAE